MSFNLFHFIAPPRRIEDILRLNNGVAHEHIIHRMVDRFQFRCDIALRTEDFNLLRALYEKAEALPSTATAAEFSTIDGYVLNGQLFVGNQDLQICFKAGLPHLLKISTEEEYSRAITFLTVLSERGATMHQNIISIRPVVKRSKFYIFMPLHPITLEHLEVLESAVIRRLWNHLSAGLSFLHQLGFAHMDVKPSNILIATNGDFILTDLGSLVPFKNRSASTKAYVPRELWTNPSGPIAEASVDWWMLAMVIFERACGGDIGRTEVATKKTVLDGIAGVNSVSVVPEDVRDELLSRLK